MVCQFRDKLWGEGMTALLKAAPSQPGQPRFSGHLMAGEILHIWLRPVDPTQQSRIQIRGPDGTDKLLSGPPSDDFQLVAQVISNTGNFDFTVNDAESHVSLCYAFHPDSVLKSGIRILFTSPQTQANDKLYKLHYSPPFGWMNDPNGLIEAAGRTHFFYQHYPHSQRWNTMHWGHGVSDNLVDWIDLPVFLFPRSELLANNSRTGGAFSGSAIPNGEGGLRIFHTDHEDGRLPTLEWQMTATTSDFISASASTPVMDQCPPLPGFGRDLRDPFVFKGPDGVWKMVLGGADNTAALVLLYETHDPTAASGWEFSGILHREPLPRAVPAECPCVLPLDGEGQGLFALIFGLIGHQTPILGRLNPSFALVGRFDGKRFEEVARRELDFIGDYYAFQGFSYQSRPVGFAWAANWATIGRSRDFPSAASFARRLVWEKNQLHMPPVETVGELRAAKLAENPSALVSGLTLPNGLAEIRIELDGEGPFQLTFAHADGPLTLSYEDETLDLSLPQARQRVRSTQQGVKTPMPEYISVYVDVGLLEIFVDGGRLCGTKRLDSEMPVTSVQFIGAQNLLSGAQVWQLRPRAGK